MLRVETRDTDGDLALAVVVEGEEIDAFRRDLEQLDLTLAEAREPDGKGRWPSESVRRILRAMRAFGGE